LRDLRRADREVQAPGVLLQRRPRVEVGDLSLLRAGRAEGAQSGTPAKTPQITMSTTTDQNMSRLPCRILGFASATPASIPPTRGESGAWPPAGWPRWNNGRRH